MIRSDAATLKQLHAWYNNNGDKSSTKKAVVLEIHTKPGRRLQAVEIYGKDNYKEQVKPGVIAEVEAKSIPKKDQLALIRRHVQEAFDAEPEEVKQKYVGAAQAQIKKTPSAQEADTSPAGFAT